MSTPLIVSLPGNGPSGAILGRTLSVAAVDLEVHHFPDGESLIRFPVSVAGRNVVLFCTLNRPDEKFLPLLFAAETARQLGASGVGLVAPYLGYMRQDARFHDGEALSAKIFAATLSRAIDWLVTVDPHLHRLSALADIFSVPVDILHADAQIAAWITREIHDPLLVGPDSESAQWVDRVARLVKCPATVLSKERAGDRDVKISAFDPHMLAGHTPVILDDIISTGRTMKETVSRIRDMGGPVPFCVAVHPVFAATAYSELASSGAHIVTTNTIQHPTSRIDVLPMIAKAVGQKLGLSRH